MQNDGVKAIKIHAMKITMAKNIPRRAAMSELIKANVNHNLERFLLLPRFDGLGQ
jgi:hypothetical protein